MTKRHSLYNTTLKNGTLEVFVTDDYDVFNCELITNNDSVVRVSYGVDNTANIELIDEQYNDEVKELIRGYIASHEDDAFESNITGKMLNICMTCSRLSDSYLNK